MADKEWIKNLASATWSKGKWSQAEPDRVRDLMKNRIDDATYQILQEAQDACEMFNLYTKSSTKLTVLPLGGNATNVSGIVFMLGSCQASLSAAGQLFEYTLTTTQSFQKIIKNYYKVFPQVDPFGTLVWQAENGPIMGYDMLVKKVLEELARLAHECGDLKEHKTGGFVGQDHR